MKQIGLKPMCRNCEYSDGYSQDYERKCCKIDGLPMARNKRNRCWNGHFRSIIKFIK